jgi:hypothetical protein
MTGDRALAAVAVLHEEYIWPSQASALSGQPCEKVMASRARFCCAFNMLRQLSPSVSRRRTKFGCEVSTPAEHHAG